MAAGRSPVVEGRLGAVVEGRRLAAAGGTPQVAEGILVVGTLVVVDTLAAAGDRPLQAVASVFLDRAVGAGTPDLPWENGVTQGNTNAVSMS